MENDWEKISRLMSKPAIWVKNKWEQILRREGIKAEQIIHIEKLKSVIEQSNTSDKENYVEEFKQMNRKELNPARLINSSSSELNEINQEEDLDEGKTRQSILITKANMKPHTRKGMDNTVINKEDMNYSNI
jgi:hypothetical protein